MSLLLDSNSILNNTNTHKKFQSQFIIFDKCSPALYTILFVFSTNRHISQCDSLNRSNLYEEYSDRKLVQETEEELLKYLADENPDLAALVTKLETDWWYQDGENLYLHFGEDPENLDRDALRDHDQRLKNVEIKQRTRFQSLICCTVETGIEKRFEIGSIKLPHKKLY